MGYLKFNITAKDGKARTAILKLKHGSIMTPELMPVATKATVKAISSEDLEDLGAQLLICNTYHLMLKPGADIIEKIGGLNKFMNWKKPILTDSGGFQAFSLGLALKHGTGKMYHPNKGEKLQSSKKSFVKITDKGIFFRSVYDNSPHLLTPEKSIEVQEKLGADLILALDECTSPMSDKSYVKKSAKFICSLPFDSIAVGGSLGKTKLDMHNILDWIYPYLPEDKPRHFLGIGVVEDIFEGVERGMDLFDCVSPTRSARSGYAYVRPPLGNKMNKFRIKFTTANYKIDKRHLDPNCNCKTCKNYSLAYINHLYKSEEMLAHKLVSYHNIHFFLQLMEEIRTSIKKKGLKKLKRSWGL